MITATRSMAAMLALLLTCGCDEADPSPDASSADAGRDSGPPTVFDAGQVVPPMGVDCRHVGAGTDYPVGPGQTYEDIGDVPLESLVAGDTVRVFYRAEPYREKIMLGGQGTAEQPIRFCGVPGPGGELPILDGEDATTRSSLDFPFEGHQVRGLVIIGHPNARPYDEQPSHIVLEGFEIRNASAPYSFTNVSGEVVPYASNAAGIFVERADHVVVRGCYVHDNNNGLFMGTTGGEHVTTDVLIEGNDIRNNGSVDGFYEHNVYNEAQGVTYQFNRIGTTRNGMGNAVKERSSGVVIRYNWIEDGAHLIDLVDSQEAQDVLPARPDFHETYVYGNVLVRNGAGGSLIHYGGDSGIFENYRGGTLHVFANTFVIRNGSLADYEHIDLFELSRREERLDARNNVIYATDAISELRAVIVLGARDSVAGGEAVLAGNWISAGVTAYDEVRSPAVEGSITGLEGSASGTDEIFVSEADEDFHPRPGSSVIGHGAAIDDLPAVDLQYVRDFAGEPRASEDPMTPGAFGP